MKLEIVNKLIKVKTAFKGFHCWPDAPAKVAFLRHLHRHVFGVKVAVGVQGSDREVEFFLLQADVESIIAKELLPILNKKRSMSCEMMAELIGERLHAYKYKVIWVEVDEDEENSAQVFFDRK